MSTQPRVLRSALLAGATVLGLLLGGCATSPTASSAASGPTAGPTAAATASPTVAPTAAPSPEPSSQATGPTVASCSAADLKISHGLVEGTAGSRDTEVVLVTAVTCAVSTAPAFAIRDASGAELGTISPAGGDVLVVRPGGSYVSDVQFANWCGADPDYPLTLELRLDGESIAVSDGPFPETGDMPPCTSSGSPTLIATPWASSS